jgi:alkylation response protein AidB-like acyl-CoA dehydrogenase
VALSGFVYRCYSPTMDLRLSEEQDQLVASIANLLAKESSPERVRAAEPRGFDPALWASLEEIGIVALAVPEDRGGWGASTVDLALVAEQLGRALAPAPVIETQVAARLLASVLPLDGVGPAAEPALHQALAGERLVTLAVRPADARATLVPAGAVAGACLVLRDDRLLLVDLDGAADVRSPVENLGSAPLADVVVDDGAVELARGAAAAACYERAVDLWLTLTAAALVEIGAAAHQLTCAYAAERLAWGVPIGTFQAVAHPLADSLTALDGARLLARKAAWAADVGDPRAAELAPMAFAFAAESARDATYQAVHFHGGYGFMLETDVQLYYRRARAWARVWGEPAAAYRRAARARYAAVGAG